MLSRCNCRTKQLAVINWLELTTLMGRETKAEFKEVCMEVRAARWRRSFVMVIFVMMTMKWDDDVCGRVTDAGFGGKYLVLMMMLDLNY